jgi:hypothetical protein
MIFSRESGSSAYFVSACFALAALTPALTAAQSNTNAAATPKIEQAPVTQNMNNNKMVVRDAASGELRAATAEEAAAMQARSKSTRQASTSPSTPMTKSHASGAVGARMTDEMMIYAVVKKQSDGTLVEEHHDGLKNANAAVKSATVAKPKTLPTE